MSKTSYDKLFPDDVREDLRKVINAHGLDSICNTPDYILARFIVRTLGDIEIMNRTRDQWWGFVPEIGNPHVAGVVNKDVGSNYFRNYNSVYEIIEYFANPRAECYAMVPNSARKITEDAQLRIIEIVGHLNGKE